MKESLKFRWFFFMPKFIERRVIMSVDAGSAVAYLELDYSKYSAGLLTAKQQLSTFTDNTQEAGTRVQALGGIVTGVGSTLTTGLTVPLVTAGAASLTVALTLKRECQKYKLFLVLLQVIWSN